MWQDTGLNGDAQRIEQLGWMLFLKIFSDKDKELEILDDSYTSPIPDLFHWVQIPVILTTQFQFKVTT
jgi:type I restriction enzyme M protein